MEELRIITEERNARNAELQRRIELRKLAKLKKKKQEEVASHFFSVFQKREKGGRGCDTVCRVGGSGANRDCDEQGFFSFFLSQDFEIVTTKGSNIPRLCRVGECEECEKEKKCECECENCKEVRIGNVTHCSFVFLHICTFLYFCILTYLHIFIVAQRTYASSILKAGVEM